MVGQTLLVAGVFGLLTAVVLLMMQVAAENGSVVTPLTFEVVALATAAIGVVIAYAGFRQRGAWSLTLDETGFRMERGRMRPRSLPWSAVTRVRSGPVAVQRGRYRADLADGLRIEGKRPQDGIYLDTVRFRTSAEGIDRMARAVREAAAQHGVVAEPFPMVGRGPP